MQLKKDLDISLRTIKRIMSKMQTKGIIKRKGSSRSGEWIVTSNKEQKNG